MHMIDVMKKLQEIAEAGYDNEDIQRGIDAAGKHAVTEDAKPDFLDLDGDGDKEESMKKAVNDKEKDLVIKGQELEAYANKFGGVDKKDMMKVAAMLKRGDKSGALKYAKTLDTDPKEYIMSLIGEETELDEAEVEETVEVPVNELAELMQLAGYTDYAEKIEEYANEPEEDYMDAEEQLIGLSGGLNGPKKMYAAAAGGDNPMDQEPREVTESTFESFYKKYDKFVAELTESEQDK